LAELRKSPLQISLKEMSAFISGADCIMIPSPEDVAVLVAAFDEAWSQLEKSGVRFDTKSQRELARNTLGKSIIEDATSGERDKGRLRDNALLLYSKRQK
jgi:hypothetical protein